MDLRSIPIKACYKCTYVLSHYDCANLRSNLVWYGLTSGLLRFRLGDGFGSPR